MHRAQDHCVRCQNGVVAVMNPDSVSSLSQMARWRGVSCAVTEGLLRGCGG